MGQLRITSGSLRNRKLTVPETGAVRPMLEKPRMAIFSILGQDCAESGGVIVFIDHNLRSVMSLATRVVVLDFGAVIADDMPEKVTRLPEVEAAYQMTTGQPWAKEGQHA